MISPLIWFYKMIRGERAFITQSYAEANAKNGTSFEFSGYFSASSGEVFSAVLTTGDLPVIFKDRTFGYSGEAIKVDFYKNPTWSGGVDATANIINTNDINPATTTVTMTQGVTVTDQGSKLAATIWLLGGDKNNSSGNAGTILPSEYVLAPNTEYLLTVESLDNSSQNITVHNGWFEGWPDLPYSE